jgi:hypothetical protein
MARLVVWHHGVRMWMEQEQYARRAEQTRLRWIFRRWSASVCGAPRRVFWSQTAAVFFLSLICCDCALVLVFLSDLLSPAA